MLAPKKVKWRKQQRGRTKVLLQDATNLILVNSVFRLCSLAGLIQKQLEACPRCNDTIYQTWWKSMDTYFSR